MPLVPSAHNAIQYPLSPRMLKLDRQFVAFDHLNHPITTFAVNDALEMRWPSLIEQIGMRPGADERYRAAFASLLIDFVDQQEVAADVAIARAGPVALERVVEPFGAKRFVVSDQQQHRVFEAVHVVAP